MSIQINMKTPTKKEIADILRAVSESIEVSVNETVEVDLEVVFTVTKK